MKHALLIILITIITIISMPLLGTDTDTGTDIDKRVADLSKAEMQSIIEFMGGDHFEGRAPGTRGGDMAENYMQSLFKFMGLKPGHNGNYMQPFTLKGFTTTDITVSAMDMELKSPDHIMGTHVRPERSFKLEGEAVFVGFGITTPLWKWDDFKNVDVKDKIIIARVNDPGMFIPSIFEGTTLTYFGRWTYHLEEAARRGAKGMLLIHTTPSAGYSWQVVRNSWSGEDLRLESDTKNNLQFRGWITEDAFNQLLQKKNIKLETLYKKSLKRNFKPVNLGFKLTITGNCEYREVEIRNVVAEIPGKSDKKIVLSAHIDHLGLEPRTKEGDNIYNGAIDNGSAVAAMMMTAKILKQMENNLHYTVVLLACHAEEGGLLGSRHYVASHPNRSDIIANINFESTPVWGKTSDFMAIGARFSTLEDILKPIVQKEGLDYSYFSLSNQGFFYRSDQFSFARYQIPAIWISAGEHDDSGQKKYPAFWATDYHTVRDEYDPQWQLEGLRQTVKLTLLLMDELNKNKIIPQWKKDKLTFPFEKE